jgi:hypothetical protein
MNWTYLKANSRAACKEMLDDYGHQHVWRLVLALLAAVVMAFLAWIFFSENRWPSMQSIALWVLALVVVVGGVFLYKLVSVSIRGQVKAEKERSDAEKERDQVKASLGALETERDELKRQAEAAVAAEKPEDSDELKDARNTLRQFAVEARSVKTGDEMRNFVRQIQDYAHRRFIGDFAKQLDFAYGSRSGAMPPLSILDIAMREQIIRVLEDMAKTVREEHLSSSMSSLPPQTDRPSAKDDSLRQQPSPE